MNTFGKKFRVTIFGESHGEAVGVVLDGVPAGLPLNKDDFMADIDRRRSGARGTTPRRESDLPVILSGVYEGHTTGAPLAVIFRNENTRSADYGLFERIPRPGHADRVAQVKWNGFNDPRGGGHFSGRLTLPLVAAGVVAKKCLEGISIRARLVEVGGISMDDSANETWSGCAPGKECATETRPEGVLEEQPGCAPGKVVENRAECCPREDAGTQPGCSPGKECATEMRPEGVLEEQPGCAPGKVVENRAECCPREDAGTQPGCCPGKQPEGYPAEVAEKIEEAMRRGDSLGGVVECVAEGLPIGLGEPFFNSVESLISHAVFSIPGVRGIEFGDGFAAARMTGSQHNDPFGADGRPVKNGAGGINGGITNGAPLVFRVAFKPTSSIAAKQQTLDFSSGEISTLSVPGRHDVCFALRTPVIVEAATAIILADLQ